MRLGATYLGEGRCSFLVWAPRARRVDVVFPSEGRAVAMEPRPRGYHAAVLRGVEPATRYLFRLDSNSELPDPASRFQPDGVHGPSEIVDAAAFEWSGGDWLGLPLRDLVIYELHVGTFSAEGTFDAVAPWLDELRWLGVTAIELMPVAQFPGARNWGYDGVFPSAVQCSYGGPAGLQRLIDRCHRRGLAAILDVVHNHVGPEGDHLGEFGPYFTDRHRTPWGLAINFDGEGSDEVRRFFIESALGWFEDFHVDALRLDAIHNIADRSAKPFLRELAERTGALAERLGRRLLLIAESDLGDPRVIERPELGGLGLDAQWSDDFHHSVHALLTGERAGYYADFGATEHLARVIRDGYTYTGQHSGFRQRRHGAPTRGLPAERFVVCVQNHDQVGNRPCGERLGHLLDLRSLKLAAAILLLCPFVPLLFMGEEYAESAPFLYFVDHSDPRVTRAVRRGRRAELAPFSWKGRPSDPAEAATFERSKLQHELRTEGQHPELRALYRELLRLRREILALANRSRDELAVSVGREWLLLHRWSTVDEAAAAFNFDLESPWAVALPPGIPWNLSLSSAEAESVAEGEVKLEPRTFSLYTRERTDG